MFGTILMQRVVSAALCAATLVGLPGCTALQTPEAGFAQTRPAQTQAPERTPPDGITFGTQTQRGFVNDNIYHSELGDIHFSSYIPESYDGSEPYDLFITLPGWEGLYFQGVGANMVEDFGTEAVKYNDRMIVLSTQLDDWGETSADHTIALTEYFLEHYNIDRVYLHGMSGGGETGSLVVGKRPDLYAAYLMTSSRWDGDLEVLAQARTPVYLAIGEDDSYYGSGSLKDAYAKLHALYEAQGLSQTEIDELLVLDVRPQSYFTEHGFRDQHAGGQAFAHDEEIMNWIFSKGNARTVPEELEYIPEGYTRPAEHPGTLERLEYVTWESFSYEDHTQRLTKTAWVYLPYGYTAERTAAITPWPCGSPTTSTMNWPTT